ncbi:probable glycerol-3-phosphate acyltransferase 3 [Phtheirospermum japonicum]|uniref:Probable glycerol-3-phosphate acyltransferase 3 n=1 Tax=Phtheirospermum japonicum TaxID=374723 RepID=A0A830C3W4_9LAMI|nr:probable glycerol-3-phosphate acyltransferase 3 [Phtheirospermum japonicum]
MLVAFEAGGLIRAHILFLLYPFISIFPDDLSLKIMVMVSFIGLKKDKFNEGRSVLPKFFLEDVGKESFEVLRRGKVTVAVSDLPRVMVESFLRDYLEVDYVVGREMRVLGGYFVGVMEERREDYGFDVVRILTSNAIGVGCCFKKCCDFEWLISNCKEIYLVSEQEKRNWNPLPRDLYPKPLIFHDGRLAFRPTFWATLIMFMWLPIGFILAIVRIIIAITLPSSIALFLLHLSGTQLKVFYHNNFKRGKPKANGVLYVCNHKTLIDPLLIYYCLGTPLTAVVYSLSRMSEIISPVKTVRLTRNREKDAELMHNLLSQGDLVVCPEGTTCREPYVLRFSPLFTEICDEICPVAIDCHVSMFYGTTARGLKSLDPLFFLMNPRPIYSARFLSSVRCGGDESGDGAESSKYEKANLVQDLIAKELGFNCTRLTRKDKYLTLAGNEGVVKNGNKGGFVSFSLLQIVVTLGVVTWLV